MQWCQNKCYGVKIFLDFDNSRYLSFLDPKVAICLSFWIHLFVILERSEESKCLRFLASLLRYAASLLLGSGMTITIAKKISLIFWGFDSA